MRGLVGPADAAPPVLLIVPSVSLIKPRHNPHIQVARLLETRRMAENLTMAASNRPVPRDETDRERMERMFAAYHATVWRILRRRGLDPDAAADATQEAFLIASQRLGTIQPESERAFLISTAVQTAHTLGRKTMRWQLENEMDLRQSLAKDPGDERADIQLCDLVLSKIDADLAEAFVLYEIEGLSTPEIAASLEIPIGTVASRLRRAREQFRKAVAWIERTLQREGRT